MGTPQSQEPNYIGPVKKWEEGSKAATMPSTSNNNARRAVEGAAEIFTLEKANVKYQDRHILKDITWQLKAGDRAVLTGANGRTLLQLLMMFPADTLTLRIQARESQHYYL